ncbi:MAG: hypothetical protein ACPGWR_07020 [Ardenticatenaceae bacterium]
MLRNGRHLVVSDHKYLNYYFALLIQLDYQGPVAIIFDFALANYLAIDQNLNLRT